MTNILQFLARPALFAFCTLVVIFLLSPLLVVVPISFSDSEYLKFPPSGFSLRWYDSFFGDDSWMSATKVSLIVALISASLSTFLGSIAGAGLASKGIRFKGTIELMLMLPIIVPGIILAIAAFNFYSRLHLVATMGAIILSHTILAMPFVILMMRKSFESLNASLTEASYVMGASPAYTFLHVKLPVLAPSLISAFLLAFITSWDEVVYVAFIGGAEATTLPLKMFSYLKTEINPTIAAVSTVLLVLVLILSLFLALTNIYFRRRKLATLSLSARGGI